MITFKTKLNRKKFKGTPLLSFELEDNNKKLLSDIFDCILQNSPEQKRIEDHNLHITLTHHSYFKENFVGDNKCFKVMQDYIKNLEEDVFGPDVTLNFLAFKDTGDKKSFFAVVNEQKEVREFIDNIYLELGFPFLSEDDRTFHISISNLDGNPHSSIANISNGIYLKNIQELIQ